MEYADWLVHPTRDVENKYETDSAIPKSLPAVYLGQAFGIARPFVRLSSLGSDIESMTFEDIKHVGS